MSPFACANEQVAGQLPGKTLELQPDQRRGDFGGRELRDARELRNDIIRDASATVLRKRKGKVDPAQLYSPAKKRLDYEGQRPVECSKAGKTPTTR